MKNKINYILHTAAFLGAGLLMLQVPFQCKVSFDEAMSHLKESEEAGVGGNFALHDGKLIYHLDGTGAPAAEVSWASGDALYDGYAVKDDSGNLVTIRQYDAAKGITHANGSGSSGGSANTPACEHEYTSEVTKQPTCVDPGETTYTCS